MGEKKRNIILAILMVIAVIFSISSCMPRGENFGAGMLYYVSTSGSDSNSGAQSSPWKTIQKAANTMTAGNTVIVQAGNYSSERVQITKSGGSGTPITYKAEGTVTTKGFNIQANWIIVDGFEVSKTNWSDWDDSISAGVHIRGSYNVVENNYVHDTLRNGITIYGLYADTSSHDNIVRNNRISHVENVGIDLNGVNNLIEGNEIDNVVQCLPAAMQAGGFSCSQANSSYSLDADGMRFFGTGHTVRGNYIHNIRYGTENYNPHIDCFQTFTNSYVAVAKNIVFENNTCIEPYSQTADESGTGWMLGGASNLTIRNNVIIAYEGINNYNGSSPLYITNNVFGNDMSNNIYPAALRLSSVGNSIVKNNIIYNQPETGIEITGTGTGFSANYNLTYNVSGSAPCVKVGGSCQTANNKLNTNPMFVNPSANDYHLQPGSPACTAGENGTYIGAYPCGSTAPTATATNTSDYTPTQTATKTATKTVIKTATFTASKTATKPATFTATNTSRPSSTFTSTNTKTLVPTDTRWPTWTPSRTLTIIPTNTLTPSYTVTSEASITPTSTDTETTIPTRTKTPVPSFTKTVIPTPTPTITPTPQPPRPSLFCRIFCKRCSIFCSVFCKCYK